MARGLVVLWTCVAMVAFGANSLLCRLALRQTGLDATSFTVIRLLSGAVVLALLVGMRRGGRRPRKSWGSAVALFMYAAGFSFAYVTLPAATGALLLFGSVQATMIGYGLWKGERFSPLQVAGLAAAAGGFVALLRPGLSAPPLGAAVMMGMAGLAWGGYSLLGRSSANPLDDTAVTFARALPFAAVLIALTYTHINLDPIGIVYAAISGAIASGLGYAVWYTVLPKLAATTAATVQLSVPVIAALAGVMFLGEMTDTRFVLCSAAILGGILVVILGRVKRNTT